MSFAEPTIEVSAPIKKKKKDLGIFYTPEVVIDFIFRVLNANKAQQNGRWHHREKLKFPSVIDPAAGEGIFLKKAVQSGFTNADHIFGLDIDPTAVERWKTIHLLEDVFEGDETKLERHFFHQNGLVPVKWEQHKDLYKGLKKVDIENEQFDTVVGNPPYGGIGVNFLDSKTSPDEDELLHALKNFELLIYRKHGAPAQRQKETAQGTLFSEPQSEYKVQLPPVEVARLAQSTPIEALFIERFIQLAKPGGWIAVIIPDGILSNSNLNYVREFIAAKCYVRAIVSLPRETFKLADTNAKTSILFLEKKKEADDNKNYPVFLSSISMFIEKAFNVAVKQYSSFIQTGHLCQEEAMPK